MKARKYLSVLLSLLLLCALLAGCGSSAKSTAAAPREMAAYDSAAEEYAVAETAAGALADNGSTGSTTLPESRKWIVTVSMTAETEDLDALTAALNQQIAALGGYVEDQHVYNGSTYSSRRYRSASLTIRVPAEDADSFTEQVSGLANVVSKEKNLEDVTLRYVATESRLTALETEEARLLELLAQADNMTDLLEIEARLTDVRYELENTASQKRLYDNQIDYATIYLSIEEVQEYTPVEEPTLWERISGGFMDSLKGLGEGALDLLVWLIVCSPYLAVLAVVILCLVLLVKRIRRKRAKKPVQKDEEQK